MVAQALKYIVAALLVCQTAAGIEYPGGMQSAQAVFYGDGSGLFQGGGSCGPGGCPGGSCGIGGGQQVIVQPGGGGWMNSPPPPPPRRTQPQAPVVNPPWAGVVLIQTNTGSSVGYGSGVVIEHSNDYTYIATAGHGDFNGQITAITRDGVPHAARLVGVDKYLDFAVLSIARTNASRYTIGELGPVGTRVYAAGYGTALTKFSSIVGAYRAPATPKGYTGQDFPWFEMNGTVRGGDSGGPIVDDDWKLVGLVLATGDGATLGVRASLVQQRLNVWLAPPMEPTPPKPVPPTPPKPVPPTPPAVDCRPEIEALRTELQAELQALRGLLDQCAKTPGPPGPAGPPGPPGNDGAPGSVDGAKLKEIELMAQRARDEAQFARKDLELMQKHVAELETKVRESEILAQRAEGSTGTLRNDLDALKKVVEQLASGMGVLVDAGNQSQAGQDAVNAQLSQLSQRLQQLELNQRNIQTDMTNLRSGKLRFRLRVDQNGRVTGVESVEPTTP